MQRVVFNREALEPQGEEITGGIEQFRSTPRERLKPFLFREKCIGLFFNRKALEPQGEEITGGIEQLRSTPARAVETVFFDAYSCAR